MLDIRTIREETDRVRAGALAKGVKVDLDPILELDLRRRAILADLETRQHERNTRSREIGERKRAGEDADEAQDEVRRIGEAIRELEEERRSVEASLHERLLTVPNLPDDEVPPGNSAGDNVVVRESGESPAFDFTPRPHWELAEALGILDFERGVKIAGSGFPVYAGAGARLERALVSFFLDQAAGAGYREILPPVLANEDSVIGTGQLPDKEDQMYVVGRDDLYLIPTAEVPVTNLHRDEILPAADLPVKYAAFSANFRRESGSHGREVRGLNRVHQFHKVELVKFVEPSRSSEELDALVADAEALLTALGLRYRVLFMCAGDMGFTQAKKFDLEVWAPGQERWLEVSSCSNFRDYQSRRMKIRYRPEGKKAKPALLHTLNGSGLATPRTWITILEHYQRADGTVEVPEVLRPYTGLDLIRPGD
ncbi:MAG: serine--tRNA ligase [Gemmatimonadota bacterium]|jgi:seryl-tRNA synthetase|nr:serine--tRNA ligase [Gemmatimonadota bacterium]